MADRRPFLRSVPPAAATYGLVCTSFNPVPSPAPVPPGYTRPVTRTYVAVVVVEVVVLAALWFLSQYFAA